MAYPSLINGVSRSWSSITFIYLGIPIIGITNIEYGKKQEKEDLYGAGSEPTSRGYGNTIYEPGKITLYREEWEKIIQAAPFKDPTKIPASDAIVLFTDVRGGAKDTLGAVEFLNDPFKSKQGDRSIMIDLEFIYASITHA